MKNSCNRCEKRKNCVELCEDMKIILDGEEVGRKESLLNDENFLNYTEVVDKPRVVKTEHELVVLMKWTDKLSTREIAEKVSLSKSQINRIISKMLAEVVMFTQDETYSARTRKIVNSYFREMKTIKEIYSEMGIFKMQVYRALNFFTKQVEKKKS